MNKEELQQRNRNGTISRKTTRGARWLQPVLVTRKLALNSDAGPNYKYIFSPHRGSSTPSLKYHSEAIIIKNAVVKQSKGFNGDLTPEHKRTANRTTIGPTTDIDTLQEPTEEDKSRE